MQPHVEARSVTMKGVTTTSSFGMRAENSAHIFGILRSQLYSNKVLAVLREYGANAWDEHRAAGCPDRPIKVVLPTALEPTLRIRDYGRGLSEEQVFAVYTQYGSSTKRADNLTVGAMGIGSKSAFAYTDSFTVTSWYDGQKSVYQAVLDETNVGTMSLMWRSQCEPSETGVEISMSVEMHDCHRFHSEAAGLFKHFNPLPDINCTLPPQDSGPSPHGDSNNSRHNWIAVMGCIPYPLRMVHLTEALAQAKLPVLPGGVLCLDIGEVSVSGSREELEYTPRTCNALVARYAALIEDLRLQFTTAVDDCVESWAKRLLVLSLGPLARHLQPKLADQTVNVGKGSLGSYYLHTADRRYKKMDEAPNFPVKHGVRLVLRDCRRNFRLVVGSGDDYLVSPSDCEYFGEKETAKFLEVLSELGLDGIPLVRLSELTSNKNSQDAPRACTTPDVKKRVFMLKENKSIDLGTPSKNWEPVEITPSDDDVYVILESFVPQPMTGKEFLDFTCSYQGMLKWLGVPIPRIVGYRHSVSRPVTPEALKGTPLTQWVAQAVRDALSTNASRKEQVEASYWVEDPLYKTAACLKKCIPNLSKRLGAGHIITQYLQKLAATLVKYDRTLDSYTAAGDIVRNIRNTIGYDPNLDTRTLKLSEIYGQYPLLDKRNHGPSLSCFLDPNASPNWENYIQMVDSQTTALQAQESA